MAFKKTLAQRLFNISKISAQSLTKCRVSSSSIGACNPPNPNPNAPDPGDKGIFRRFLHKRAIFQPTILPAIREFEVGEKKLVEKIKSLGIVRDRIRLDGLTPPIHDTLPSDSNRSDLKDGLSVEDAKKLLKVAQMEMMKTKLRGIEKSWIPYSEFVRMCGQGYQDHPDQSIGIAKMLDESGSVIVLGNVVFLRPEQVAKVIQGLIPIPGAIPDDSMRVELEEMEIHKAVIDRKAESLVRRELWCGLGYLVVQTAAFMRLTFWELSWDVMEPICFYVTSFYFMAGYTFFLRTSKEPSFEGFFQGRFSAKQKRLMRQHNFDIARYNELRKACYPYSSSAQEHPSPHSLLYGNSEKMQLTSL